MIFIKVTEKRMKQDVCISVVDSLFIAEAGKEAWLDAGASDDSMWDDDVFLRRRGHLCAPIPSNLYENTSFNILSYQLINLTWNGHNISRVLLQIHLQRSLLLINDDSWNDVTRTFDLPQERK